MSNETKQTPNECICESTDVILTHDTRPGKGYRAHCCWCERSGGWYETSEQSITDWNRQTAAPEYHEAAEHILTRSKYIGEGPGIGTDGQKYRTKLIDDYVGPAAFLALFGGAALIGPLLMVVSLIGLLWTCSP